MKMLRGAAFLLLTPSIAFAQPQTGRMKPSPEAQRLGYYVGVWEGRGETKAGPFGQAGKLSSKMTCTWFGGRFQVLCKGEETGPSGKRQFLNILAFDETAKAYTQYSISSFGETEYDQHGSWIGDKVRYVVDQDAGGAPAKFRYTETHVSPVLMAYQAEISVGRKPWTVLAEGKIRKVR